MKSLVFNATLVFALLASGHTLAQDPSAPGPFTVLTAKYDRGDTAFDCTPDGCDGAVPNAELRAEVYYPSSLSAGPFPLVLFLHGNHLWCYDRTDGSASFFDPWPCATGTEPIPNYRGYDYIGRVLASHGYIVASISANGINARSGSSLGIVERAHLVQAHLDLWNEFDTTGSTAPALDDPPFASSFIGEVDLDNVGTMGHSRGGDAVVNHFALFPGGAPYNVRAVLPIEPTNFLGAFINNVDLGVLLGYCDGDVFPLPGAQFYDQARYAVAGDESTKYTFLALGANHNYFNTVWTAACWENPGSCWPDARGETPAGTDDDFTAFTFFSGFDPADPHCGPSIDGNGRLSPSQQRAVGLAYVAAFFRSRLGGETEFAPLLQGDLPAPAPVDPRVHVGYHPPASRRIDLNRLTEESEETQTTLTGTGGVRGPVTNNDLLTYDRCGFDFSNACFVGTGASREVHLGSPGLSRLRTQWDETSDSFVNELPAGARNVAAFDALQFRVGVDYTNAANPTSTPAEFSIVLADGSTSAIVNSSLQLGRNDLYFPPGGTTVMTTVMNTLRVPLSQFTGVNLTDLRRVTLQYDRSGAGTILLSDIAFVNDVEPPNPACQASESFVVSDRAHVTTPDGRPAVHNSGTGQTLISFDARTNGVQSVGQVRVLDRAIVTGDVRSSNSITVSPTATVTGTQTQFAGVMLPPLPALPTFPPPTGGPIFVNPGGVVPLAPGSRGSVTVNSGGFLRLSAGDYFFQSFTINSSSRVEVTPTTRVFVQSTLNYRSPFVNASNAVQPIALGFGGMNLIVEARFDGTLLAPNARVEFGIGSGLTFTGSFLGRTLVVRPQSALVCTDGPDIGGVPPTPSCSDGVRNGTETGLDCGGPSCPDCPPGQGCSNGGDCTSGICTGGICQPPAGSVTVTRTVTADWGGGYCVTLRVTNGTTLPTTNFSVSLNTNQSTIYTNWNGNFSALSGVISVTPAFDWNRVIPPGATNDSIGFCANRTVPGSGVLPILLGASGTF